MSYIIKTQTKFSLLNLFQTLLTYVLYIWVDTSARVVMLYSIEQIEFFLKSKRELSLRYWNKAI